MRGEGCRCRALRGCACARASSVRPLGFERPVVQRDFRGGQLLVDDRLNHHDYDDADSETTYEDIYNEYTQKLQDATPGLIDEYNQEAAANTDGMTGLATICNKKISELAKINTEGTKKMAQLMYTSGNGSYQDYEDWAMKLSDVYTTEAQKITDAYTSSAM